MDEEELIKADARIKLLFRRLYSPHGLDLDIYYEEVTLLNTFQ